jgi:hypothetical protein
LPFLALQPDLINRDPENFSDAWLEAKADLVGLATQRGWLINDVYALPGMLDGVAQGNRAAEADASHKDRARSQRRDQIA